MATGAAGAVLGEIAEYVVFDADVIGDDQWFEAMEDLFADRGLVGQQVAERQRHGELLRAGGRQPRGLFATALCAMSQPARSAPGEFSDGHDLRVVTLWWASFSDGDAVVSGTVQDLRVAKATIWERWFVYAVGPRRVLSPAGVAAEVARCEQPLDAEALADDGSALRSRVLNAPDTAARIVGLLRYAAPAATAAVTEWERVVVDAAAPQYAHVALEAARVERAELAQRGVWSLLRAPVCFIERLAPEPPGDGLSSPRLIELLTEQWFIDETGAAHDVGPYLTAVPIARTADERWVQYADRRDVISDTSTQARADAIRRHLAACTAF